MHKIIKLLLNSQKEIVLSSHTFPDGDALGSVYSLALALKQINKKVKILIDDNIPKIPFDIKISKPQGIKKGSILIIVDAGEISKLPNSIVNLEFSQIIFIDHHKPKVKIKGAMYFINIKASSTGEIIYLFLKNYLKTPFTKEIAKGIYTALVTDTRSFKYSRTTALSHKIAYHFIKDKLIKPELIQNKIYNNQNINFIKFKGHLLSTVRLSKSRQIAYVVVNDNVLKKYMIETSELKSSYNDLFAIENVNTVVLVYKNKAESFFYVKTDKILNFELYFKKHIIKINKYSCTFKLLNSIDENIVIKKLEKLL